MDVIVISAGAVVALSAIGIAAFCLIRWRRNHFRFSLRAMLILFVLLSCATYATIQYIVPVITHRRAIGRLYRTGGSVLFREDYDPNSGQIYSGTDDSQWRDVMIVHARSDAEAVSAARELKYLPEVQSLFLSRVTDKALIAIGDSDAGDAVETIDFFHSQVTSDGLSRLARLKQLRTLFFSTCNLRDLDLAGLESLQNLRNLTLLEERPSANPDRFTEAGFQTLSRLDQLEYLWLAQLRISPASASHLKKLRNLKRLRISRYLITGGSSEPDLSLVSDETIADLRQSLPNCKFEIFPPDLPTNAMPNGPE